MSVDRIRQARENYFKKKPFNPHENSLMAHDLNGMPSGFLTLPDMGEMQVVAMKFGYEFLATCKTDDDVDNWLAEVSKTAQSPELMGIMLAHAFRGIAPLADSMIETTPGLRDTMQKISADGWEKDFSNPEEN